MRWWGNGSISEISVAKAGLNRYPYVRRSPSTTTRTTSGSAVKSMEGATAGRLSYTTLDAETVPLVDVVFFTVYTPLVRIGEPSSPYLCSFPSMMYSRCTVSNTQVYVKPFEELTAKSGRLDSLFLACYNPT